MSNSRQRLDTGELGCLLVTGLMGLTVVGGIVFVAVWGFHLVLPLWGALLLGVPIGTGIAALLFYLQEGTLIERIVPTFIIVALALILIPIFNKARDNARKAKARNQLILNKQMAPQNKHSAP